MNITIPIAQAVTDVFTGENWTDVNLQQALQNIDFEMAQTKVPFTENTIAKLVYHLKYSNEVVLQRAHGIRAEYDNENDGFNVPLLQNDKDWQRLIQETFLSAQKFSEAVENFPEEKLFEPILPGFSSANKNFQGISEHAHYHLGHIVMIKKYLEIKE